MFIIKYFCFFVLIEELFLKGFGKVIYFVFFEEFWVNGCCCLVGVEIFWEKFLKLEGNKGLKFIFNK